MFGLFFENITPRILKKEDPGEDISIYNGSPSKNEASPFNFNAKANGEMTHLNVLPQDCQQASQETPSNRSSQNQIEYRRMKNPSPIAPKSIVDDDDELLKNFEEGIVTKVKTFPYLFSRSFN